MNVKLNEILSSRERLEILKEAIYLESSGVVEISKKLNLSKGLVSKYFDILRKEGIMKREKKRFVVWDNYKTRAIKIMLNILSVPDIFSKYKFVKSAGLYGSSAKGRNTKESDVDLWVKIEKAKDSEIAKLNSELSGKIQNINILMIDDDKLKEIKKKDELFYYSLYFGSVIIYGEESEI